MIKHFIDIQSYFYLLFNFNGFHRDNFTMKWGCFKRMSQSRQSKFSTSQTP
ncbi:hypothetical protein HMPREF1436_00881 [Helicobacter pylori GAMchJs136i]|nr:hypothetical protein HMPREF1436_00881 [Helicobacter pylori GAMchJs136i]